METKEAIRDFYNRIIGYVITNTVTGDKIVTDFYNRRLGYYDAKQNVTRDFYNRIVARGDSSVGLIYAEDAKNKK